jgi:AraC-like DNA-binding protein
MNKKLLQAPPLVLKAGTFIDKKYQTYNEMSKSSTDNWKYHCTYELCPKALTGRHQVLQLETMFISFGERPGGMMHDVLSAQNTVTFAVQVYLEDKACFDRLKLQTGDILVFDDTKPYNYMTNAKVELAIVTIRKGRLGGMLPTILTALVHKYRDVDGKFSQLLSEIWQSFTSDSPSTDYCDVEEKILAFVHNLVNTQIPIAPYLTKGEEVSYAIREELYHHMDGNIKIEDLVKRYGISERNLQNSFKALFGFTPKLFMRLLKLNLIRHDLSYICGANTSISEVAHKWGMLHMGRFGQYYKALFEETPSETLKRRFDDEKAFTGECVERQEEIN